MTMQTRKPNVMAAAAAPAEVPILLAVAAILMTRDKREERQAVVAEVLHTLGVAVLVM